MDVRPPARRGDVDRLVHASPGPGVVVVCDGVFQAEPAVSHAELCRALDAGWQVWGVSSLGAIRAYELRDEGMRGFGQVYEMFHRLDDFTDDELCLLHFPEPPWFPVSEALVNIRHALARFGPEAGIGEAAAALVVDELRALWFGDRTEDRLRALLSARAGIGPKPIEQLLRGLRAHRLKTIDLAALLERRPWHGAHSAGTP
jgi:hypothetical protein